MWSISIESSVVSANDCTLYSTLVGILTLFASGAFCLTKHANMYQVCTGKHLLRMQPAK